VDATELLLSFHPPNESLKNLLVNKRTHVPTEVELRQTTRDIKKQTTGHRVAVVVRGEEKIDFGTHRETEIPEDLLLSTERVAAVKVLEESEGGERGSRKEANVGPEAACLEEARFED